MTCYCTSGPRSPHSHLCVCTCVSVVVCSRYNPGDQVFLCYGRHTNLDLLELYGFMLDDNPHDQALLPLDTIQHNMQQLLKQRQRQQQGEGRQWKRQQQQPVMCRVDVGAADSWVSVRGYPSWELLRALRWESQRSWVALYAIASDACVPCDDQSALAAINSMCCRSKQLQA